MYLDNGIFGGMNFSTSCHENHVPKSDSFENREGWLQRHPGKIFAAYRGEKQAKSPRNATAFTGGRSIRSGGIQYFCNAK